MAQDAELRLKVSLDLAFFRQQLAGLGQAAAGYKMPVQVHFDRRSIQNELNALGANLRRRTYRLTVETNISAEIAKAETLARKLGELSGKLKTGGGGFSGSAQGAAGLMEYMRSQGLSGGGGFVGVGRSTRLKNALEELTVKQLQGLAKSESISGVSRLKKSSLIEKLMNDLSQQAMENILGNAQMALRRPVRGIFAAGRTIAQGPLGRYGMAGGTAQGPTLPTRPIFATGNAATGGAGQLRYNMGGDAAIAGLLGPAGTTGGFVSREAYLAQRQLQAQLRSNARRQQVLREDRMAAVVSGQVPLGGGGPFLPPGGPPGGGGGLFGGAGGFGRAIGTLNLPGTGTIKELGTEFAFAAKQVLLFGTAYKALAFVQDFPGQVGQAVSQLQTFNNTLSAITPNAQEAAASNNLILQLVEKYNIPLQSARDGFTKLYASMNPAGFGGEEIRNLFTGISKAAATFGMSADKVDRVNYAFAQMASKGQVMSEELKGQLGDVLPGAMAIFARAAGFEGPKAIQQFSAELEAGRYKGLAMVDLLNNVGIVMNTKFAKGAEGAAKTFQGAINNMQTSLTLFYQAFEPAAVAFLNSFISPISSQLKILADGFDAFFKGTAAKTSGGMALAKELNNLKPSIDGILANLRGLIPVIQTFGNVLGGAAKFAMSLASDPLVGYLMKLYAIVLPLNMAFNVLRSALFSNISQFILFNVQVGLGTSRAAALRTTIALTGGTALTTTNAIRALNLSITSLVSRTIIGAAIIGLSILIEKFATAGIAADNAKQKMLNFADSVKAAGQAADVSGLETTLAAEKKMVQRLKEAQGILKQIQVGKGEITRAQAEELKTLGLASNVAFARQRTSQGSNLQVQVGAPGAITANILAAQKGYLEAQTRIVQTQRALTTATSKQIQEETKLNKIREGGEAEDSKKQSLESYENLADQLAKARNEGDMERARILFDYRKRLLDIENRYQLSGANEIQQVRLKLAKELSDAYINYEEAVFQAGQNIQKAAGSVAPGNRPPAVRGGSGGGVGLVPVGEAGARPMGQNALNTPIGAVVGGGQVRPVSGSERRDVVAAAQTEQAVLTENVRLNRELLILKKNIALIIKENFSQIYPTEQLKLENQLLAQRNALEAQGFSSDYIAKEQAIFVARQKGVAVLDALRERRDAAIPVFEKYQALESKGIPLTKAQKNEYTQARSAIDAYADAVNTAAQSLKDFTDTQNNALKGQRQSVGSALTGQIGRETPMGGMGLRAGYIGDAATTYEKTIAGGGSQEEAQRFAELQNRLTLLQTRNNAIKQSIYSIGDAFGTAMTQGITSIIQGTATAQEVFSSFLKAVGDALLQAASQMIATYIAIGIAKAFAFGNSGGGSSSTVGFGAGDTSHWANIQRMPMLKFAEGGMVTGPTLGLIGEGGEPEYVIPQSKMRSAMDRYAAGARGPSVIPTSADAGGGEAMAAMMSPIDVRYTVERINSVDYVTADQFQVGMAQAARQGAAQGEQRTLRRMQMSASTRRRIGL